MVKIDFSGIFNKMYGNLITHDEELGDIIASRILIFKQNPDDTRLENHALKKNMRGKRAFSVTDDIRIIYKWIGKSTVRFLAIGTHEQVYTS